jgi:hypothetical protein
MTRAPDDEQRREAGGPVNRPNRRMLTLVPRDSSAEPPEEFVSQADNLVFLLELAPQKIRVETGVAEPDERVEARDVIARALAWGTQKDRWIVEGLQAVAIFYACRNATTFRRASAKLGALPVSPTVLFQLVQTAQAEAVTDWDRVLAAHRGGRRGKANERLKTYVITKFREGRFENPARAGVQIAKPFLEPAGAPELDPRGDFGADIVLTRIEKTFEEWIRAWLRKAR